MAALARAQKDVVTLPEVLSCGLSASGADNWIRSGRLHPKYPGVYAFGRPDLTPEGHRMAAVKACGPGAALSFVSAASHRGFRASASAYVDVTIPRGRPLLRLKGIRCHRCDLAPQDLTEFEGIPLTSVSRTLLDLACVLRPGPLESAAKQAVIIEAFDMREMEDLLRRSKGHRGVRRLREVLEKGDLSAGNVPRSGLEVRYAELCAAAGLPKPEINRYILLGDGYHQVDFYWRKERVVIETDGRRYHSTGWQRERDANRDNELDRAGIRHARLSDDHIEHRPHDAVAQARTLLGR